MFSSGSICVRERLHPLVQHKACTFLLLESQLQPAARQPGCFCCAGTRRHLHPPSGFFFWQAVIVLWRPLEWRALKSFSVVLHRIKTFLVSVGENVFFFSLSLWLRHLKDSNVHFPGSETCVCCDIRSMKRLPLWNTSYANSSCVFGSQLCNLLYLISCVLCSLVQ